MRNRFLLSVGCVLVVLLNSSCGSDVVSPEDVPQLPPGVAPPLAGCSPPPLVPEGRVWIGGLRWIDGAVVPNSCHPPGAPGFVALRLVVPAVFLDADEVTGECYSRCVDDAGCVAPDPVVGAPAWNDAQMARVPVVIDRARAEAFCAWRGGRLPTLAELTRASRGDALAMLNGSLHSFWVNCMSHPDAAGCDPVELLAAVESWPTPIRSWNLDVGPFGHHDLAASLLELTSSKYAFSQQERDALCEIPMDSLSPGTFGAATVGFLPGASLLVKTVEDEDLAWLVQGAPLVGGVHCAYDPSP